MHDHRKKSSRSEAFATLDVILPNGKGVHELKIKVDTGAEGNTLPLRTFQQMFPEWVDQNSHPRPGTTLKESAILTVYNGSSIPQHGSVGIQCAYKGKRRYVKFYVVTSNGPTILGLPSLQELNWSHYTASSREQSVPHSMMLQVHQLLLQIIREFSSKEVIAFIKQIFAEQGIPERLISDNDSHFSSQHFREFAKAWDFEHITSSLKYP